VQSLKDYEKRQTTESSNKQHFHSCLALKVIDKSVVHDNF